MKLKLANYGSTKFYGWKKATVSSELPVNAGKLFDSQGNEVLVVKCKDIGDKLSLVDVKCFLTPNQFEELDLSALAPINFTQGLLPQDPLTFFGIPKINNTLLGLVALEVRGAGFKAHFRARFTKMLVADLWVDWYPGQNWMEGEVSITCSNPSVPDVSETLMDNITLSFGNSLVAPYGHPYGNTLMFRGDRFIDGQCRTFPVTFGYVGRLNLEQANSAYAIANQNIRIVGSEPWPGQKLQPKDNVTQWVRTYLPKAIDSLFDWNTVLELTPSKRSNDTGAQGDQVFVNGLVDTDHGIGSELVTYLAALSMGKRPCHHLEADGSLLSLTRHPQLVMWDSRPHWHTGVSPDRLGKGSNLDESQTGGWWGADVEHWLINNLCTSYRLTGSPALQRLIEMQARIYLYQWTVADGLSTSQPYAARAVGWEGLNVVWLFNTLEDRFIADLVRDRWIARFNKFLKDLGKGTNDIWDIRIDDPRLGAGEWWIPWQQAVGGYGMYVAGKLFNIQAAKDLGIAASERVLNDAWVLVNGRWNSIAQKPVVGEGNQVNESFNYFGLPMALIVLDYDNAHVKAKSILTQLLTESNGFSKWIPPEVYQFRSIP